MYVLPMAVVHELSDECVRLHGAIAVHLRHVHIVHKVHHGLVPGRAKVAAGLFLQRLLQDLLQHFYKTQHTSFGFQDHSHHGATS